MHTSISPLLEKYSFPKELLTLIESYGSIIYRKSNEQFFYDVNTYENTLFVIKGSFNLYLQNEEKKVLLYQLFSDQMCIANHVNLFNNYIIDFYSIALEDSILLSVPSNKMMEWSSQFKELRHLIITSHQHHYNAMLGVIQSFTEESLENRLHSYLKLKSVQKKANELAMPHQEIASDLNCSREAVTRSLKKLEVKGYIERKTRSVVLTPIIEQAS